MQTQSFGQSKKNAFNSIAPHPLQSYEWGEFREKTGVKVTRRGFQMTIHKIPYTPWTIGYLPRGGIPTKEMLEELEKIGQEEKCVFIQLEPYVKKMAPVRQAQGLRNDKWKIVLSSRPFFHKYTFIIDLTKSEEELLKNMHPKTRYNIKIAQKHGVEIMEDNSDDAFETYLKLTKETTKRQGFYAHTENYHRTQWQILKSTNGKLKMSREAGSRSARENNRLTSHLLTAKYKGKILTAWILFVFHDTLYYPYGASSNEHKEVMSSNLMMWEAIRFGKTMGIKKFDLWGCLGPNPDPKDPWYGFHRFKEGYGGELVEFIGSYDFVINSPIYEFYKIANKARWMLLKIRKA